MKKIAVLAALALSAPVVSAQASPHRSAPSPGSHRCQPRNAGYNASGALVRASLTPVAGRNRYRGTLEVDLARAGHRAPTGDQTFTLKGARVIFHRGVDPALPAPGSRVKLHGKITKLAKHCPTEGFTPTITVKKVDLRPGKHGRS